MAPLCRSSSTTSWTLPCHRSARRPRRRDGDRAAPRRRSRRRCRRSVHQEGQGKIRIGSVAHGIPRVLVSLFAGGSDDETTLKETVGDFAGAIQQTAGILRRSMTRPCMLDRRSRSTSASRRSSTSGVNLVKRTYPMPYSEVSMSRQSRRRLCATSLARDQCGNGAFHDHLPRRALADHRTAEYGIGYVRLNQVYAGRR